MLQMGIFNWDMKTQGFVLGAFFYGYATTQVIGGTIAQKIGGKLLMLFGVAWTAVLTLFTPILTTFGGFGAIFAVRLLEGMGEVCRPTWELDYVIQHIWFLSNNLNCFVSWHFRLNVFCMLTVDSM